MNKRDYADEGARNVIDDPKASLKRKEAARKALARKDEGRYINGYRVYRDGYYREDFGSDR